MGHSSSGKVFGPLSLKTWPALILFSLLIKLSAKVLPVVLRIFLKV